MVTNRTAKSAAQLASEEIVYYAVVNSLEVLGPLFGLLVNW